MKIGGIIAFHDYFPGFPDAIKAIDQHVQDQFVDGFYSLIWFKKIKENQ